MIHFIFVDFFHVLLVANDPYLLLVDRKRMVSIFLEMVLLVTLTL